MVKKMNNLSLYVANSMIGRQLIIEIMNLKMKWDPNNKKTQKQEINDSITA